MAFTKIEPSALEGNFINKIGKEWPLLTAEKDGKVNTMTVNWGGMGVLWNEPVATVFVRPSRHTYEFIDSGDRFTLSFFEESYKKTLAYLGSASGRDEDKIAKAGLTTIMDENGAYFAEADLVLSCKILYRQDLDIATLAPDKIEQNYAEGDVHRMYIGKIETVLKK